MAIARWPVWVASAVCLTVLVLGGRFGCESFVYDEVTNTYKCGYKAEKARACKHNIMQHVAEADCSLCSCRTMDRESMDSNISWFNKHMRQAKSKDCMEPTKVKCVIVESMSDGLSLYFVRIQGDHLSPSGVHPVFPYT